MTRSEIIERLQGYFDISELVCKHTYERFGAKSWRFLSTDILEVLLVLREDILKVPLTCNAGSATQRGLRCNCCSLVADKTRQGKQYLSAHVLGRGFDLLSSKMSATEMRQRIKASADKLPHKVRIEQGVSWLHIDTLNDGSDVIEYFAG